MSLYINSQAGQAGQSGALTRPAGVAYGPRMHSAVPPADAAPSAGGESSGAAGASDAAGSPPGSGPGPGPHPDAGARLRRRSLLLVAQDAAVRLGPGLREAGFTVRTVRDRDAAEQELSRQPYDLVLVELAPPLAAAAELLAALCRHGAIVLALVAAAELKDGEAAAALIAAGAYDCLSLPCRSASSLRGGTR